LLEADELLEVEGEDDHGAVKALTDRIGDHMRGLLIEADPEADQALVDRVDRIYAAARGRSSDPTERVERRRVIAAGIDRLRADRPDHYDDILMQVRRYDEPLRRFWVCRSPLHLSVSTRGARNFARSQS